MRSACFSAIRRRMSWVSFSIKRAITSALAAGRSTVMNKRPNVIGVGTASFITKKAVDKIDFDAMYTNCIASTDPHAGRIPIVLADEETALRAAIFNCPRIDHSQAKVVWIKDTLHLIDIKVSESLLKICEADPAHFTVL